MSRSKLVINLESLRKNIQTVKNLITKDNFFYPFIKSDAYGLGVKHILPVFLKEGISEFGILNVKEAKNISNPKVKLLLFGPMEDISSIVENKNWIPVIHQMEDLKKFSDAVSKNKTKHSIHIKINIGMARLGFDVSDIESVISYLKEQTHLQVEGVCGHLPCGEDLTGISQEQIKTFKEQVQKFKNTFPNIKPHLYNSYSLTSMFINNQALDFGCRIGGLFYGAKPLVHFENEQAKDRWNKINLKPVATLKSFIVSSRKIPKDEGVSYGWNWIAKKDSSIAVVGMGYADGMWKNLQGAQVLFRGKKVPIVGDICMNFFMIDLTEVLGSSLPKAKEEVVIYGRQKDNEITISDLAKHTGSIPYEIMTNIGFSLDKVVE